MYPTCCKSMFTLASGSEGMTARDIKVPIRDSSYHKPKTKLVAILNIYKPDTKGLVCLTTSFRHRRSTSGVSELVHSSFDPFDAFLPSITFLNYPS